MENSLGLFQGMVVPSEGFWATVQQYGKEEHMASNQSTHDRYRMPGKTFCQASIQARREKATADGVTTSGLQSSQIPLIFFRQILDGKGTARLSCKMAPAVK